MSNRVEDLESQVAELQATVDGLTEELVETKERVRQLEDTTGELETGDESPGHRQRGGEPRSQTTAEQQAEARGTDERRDAQLVENRDPVEETAEPAEESPVEAESEADDDDDDDEIIVA